MTAPLVAYVAIAGQRDFDVPFPYLNPSHVEVRVNSTNVPILEWVSQSRLRLASPPGADVYVEVRRNTPIDDALVDFQNGAVLTEEDLNTAVLQLLYKQQEVTALYETSLLAAKVRLAAANGLPVSPEDVVNQLVNLVLEDEVLANFRQRIADIDANSEALALTAGEIINLSNAVTGEITELAEQITDPTTGNVRLKTLLDNLRADHQTLSGVVDSLVSLGDGEGIASFVQQEADARIDGDAALAALISLIGAKNNDNSAFILDLQKVRVSPSESLATRFSVISSNTASNTAAIQNEANTRTTALAAEATARQQLNAALSNTIANESSERKAAVISEQTARATAIAAEASSRQQLAAVLNNRIDGEATSRAAAITSEQNARTTAIAAEASARQLLGTNLTTAINGEKTSREAAILNEQNARSTAIASEATARQQLGASLNTAINNESAARAAAIQNEQTVRANAITAEANQRSIMGAAILDQVDDDIAAVTAQIQAETNARVSALSAEASQRELVRSSLDTKINGETTARTAAITTEANTRATADTVIANTVALIGAKSTDGTSFILDENKVKVANGTSLGVRLSGIDTAVGNINAAVVTEQNARSSADSALANSLSTVSTTVNGLTSSVSTLSQSVNGLNAKYGVSLDVNGYVTGFMQNNSGYLGSFDIIADRFRVVVPGVGARTVFDVTAQGVTMNGNVTINGTLLVGGSVTTTQLGANAATAGAHSYVGNAVQMTPAFQNAGTVTLNTVGGAAKIDFACLIEGKGVGSGVKIEFRLLRNGTVIRTGTLCLLPGEQVITLNGEFTTVPIPVAGMHPFFVLDTTAPTGSVTYTAQLGASYLGWEYCQFSERQMSVTEFRR